MPKQNDINGRPIEFAWQAYNGASAQDGLDVHVSTTSFGTRKAMQNMAFTLRKKSLNLATDFDLAIGVVALVLSSSMVSQNTPQW